MEQSLYQRFDSILAPYAVHNFGEHGRQYPEAEHPRKLPFQRDRDRILHSKAFRRLKHKTQVMISPQDDHVRDRMMHSLAGAQVARGITRSLSLNEDLAEAIILAHDIGHPPFGHEGEFALDEMMKPLGFSFDHNEHGVRIVTELENTYPDFTGLNLTQETIGGMRKHHTPWEDEQANPPHNASIEAQIVNLADEISYYSHDTDDGLRVGLLDFKKMQKLELIQIALELISKRTPNVKPGDKTFTYQLFRNLVQLLANDVTEQTEKNIAEFKITTVQDVYALNKPVAQYSQSMKKSALELRKYLFENFYQSEVILDNLKNNTEMLKELFTKLYESPMHLPQNHQDMIDNPDSKAIVVKDYIAGMTDNFAIKTVLNLRKRLI